MKSAKDWVSENTFATDFSDAVTLLEAVQADALAEAAKVVRDAMFGKIETADVLDDMADSLLRKVAPVETASPSRSTIGDLSPWAVLCHNHGSAVTRVYLTHDQYSAQMYAADSVWICPVCGCTASFDDENWEQFIEAERNAEVSKEF